MDIQMRRALRRLPAALLLALAACAPPTPETPRPTAPTILEITPAPTQDVDATATVYARQLIPSPTPTGLYVVQRGDTLSTIAEDFGSTVEEIMAANGLTDPDALQAGQTLLIPSLISGTLPLSSTLPLSGATVLTPTLAPDGESLTPTISTP